MFIHDYKQSAVNSSRVECLCATCGKLFEDALRFHCLSISIVLYMRCA